MVIGTSLLTTLLGLAGILLGLSILVQVVQECWKYVLSTKSAAYQRALFTFLGPWARELLRPGVIPDLQVDGPLQLWRRRPRGRLLPMDQATFSAALERTAAPWIRRVVQMLRAEAELQSGTAALPSAGFTGMVEQLRATGRGSPGYSSALEILRFLDSRQTSSAAQLDAARLLATFRQQFLPHVTEAERNFAQLDRNFEYAYRRRNTALTFVFALGVVLVLDAPVGLVYRQAKAMSPEQAVALAEEAQQAYDSLSRMVQADSTAQRAVDSVRAEDYRALSTGILTNLRSTAGVGPGAVATEAGFVATRWNRMRRQLREQGFGWAVGYLLECLVTALLISFGAPFWNDVAGAVLRVSKGSSKVELGPAVKGGET